MLLFELRRFLTCGLFLIFAFFAQAQDQRLADQYYNNGEYEKAVSIYEQLFKTNNNDYFFQRVVDCLTRLERFDDAIETTEKQLKKDPKRTMLYVTLGSIYQQKGQGAKAAEQYEKAIAKLADDRGLVYQTANQFMTMQETDYALRTYERGALLAKDNTLYAMQMADLYQRKDNVPKMVEMYLNSIEGNASNLPQVQSILSRGLSDAEAKELQAQLMTKIQSDAKNPDWPELLAWLYLQKKDYKNAFRQLKALDRMLEEDGARVYQLAELAFQASDWDAAISGYDYIIAEKGIESPFFVDSKHHMLSARRNKVVRNFAYKQADLDTLDALYAQFIGELGITRFSAPILAERAQLQGIYLHRLDSAIAMLQMVVDVPGVDRNLQANSKLSMGDFYLMQDEPWESTLLYSQVDKAFKDDAIGQEARYRNAKLSYFKGDFEWAKTQFDVLKSGTSKLISNDAIDMSVFIMDNMGVDSLLEPLQWYASAELLFFQNRFDEMLSKLDDIQRVYPDHNLADDILYIKARMFDQRQMFPEALKAYEEVLTKHKEGIRADNSLFRIAELTEEVLADKEKAKTLYEQLFTEFSNSTFAVEARKRYRTLRGDNVQ